MQTIPSIKGDSQQVLWVNLHVGEIGEKSRLVPLIDSHEFRIPDAAEGSGHEWAVEVIDIVYQVLTEKLGEIRRRPTESETNARPGDTTVP
jgi:hypothetical protein